MRGKMIFVHVSGLIPCPNSDRVLQDFYFILLFLWYFSLPP
jgi:hypothetical protein